MSFFSPVFGSDVATYCLGRELVALVFGIHNALWLSAVEAEEMGEHGQIRLLLQFVSLYS